MKKFFATLVALASATSATAGTLVYTPPVDAVIIEEAAPMGSGSGVWLIPLLLIGLIYIATKDDGGEVGNGAANGRTN